MLFWIQIQIDNRALKAIVTQPLNIEIVIIENHMLYLKFILCFLVLALFIPDQSAISQTLIEQKNQINIRIENKSFQSIIQEITKQSGYQIIVSEEFLKIPVTGIYQNTTLDNFLRRIFKEYNVSIIYDDFEQVAYVHPFGEKVAVSETFSSGYQSQPSTELASNFEEIDPLSGIPLAILEKKQLDQIEELERINSNPNAIDPLSGMYVSEMNEKIAEQQMILQEANNNPEAVDPLSGLPLIELHEDRLSDSNHEDPDAVDPLSGIPIKRLQEISAKQMNMLKEMQDEGSLHAPLLDMEKPAS
jgi:hypothetical protein